jgi:galactitol PTS system EIIC component
MYKRNIELINDFSYHSPYTIAQLASQYQVSVQTIRNDINAINQMLSECNCEKIQIKSGSIIYPENFANIKKYINQKIAESPFYFYHLSKEELCTITIIILIFSKKYVTINQLCEMLFVSRTTFINSSSELHAQTATLGLTVHTSSNKGIILKNTESEKRNALRAGLKAGIGLTGVSLITNYLITTLSPVISYYAETSSGARFDIVDVPWSVSAALPFALPISVFLIPCFAVLTVVLVRMKVFHTLQLSIWDYGQQLTVIGFIYVLSGNMILAVACGFLNFIFCLWCGDKYAERWSETLGLEGTTSSNVTQMSMAFPVCWIANKIMDLIPAVKNNNFTPEKISKKIGIFGEPAVIGLIVGMFMAIITKQDITSIFSIGMGVSASIVLIPHTIKIFLDGVGALTQGAQVWAGNKLGEGHKVYIACDMAMSVGSPVVITINSLMIPLAVAFALLVPGFRYFPTGLMGGIIYMVGICTVYCKNDFVRSFVF